MSKKSKPTEMAFLQFSKIKGVHSGPISEAQWLQNPSQGYTLNTPGQQAKEVSRDYLAGQYDPATGKITWKKVILMEVGCEPVKQREEQTTIQKWNMEHKVNMVGQFGTSKSKRKLNQMMNNMIS